MPKSWGFYGRSQEERDIEAILARGRWFFCRISGRRRIGKTTLITRLLERHQGKKSVYIQIPDSDPTGVLKSVSEALDDFDVPGAQFPRPKDLKGFARSIRSLCEAGYLVVLDEFQYFNRKGLSDFRSFLQLEVDRLRENPKAAGGLFVLGPVHNELSAILENRDSPLFNRVTDNLDVKHLDFATLRELWEAHEIRDPYHRLFLWSLFEGVPEFYRDCYEQGVLAPSMGYREKVLEAAFFRGSSPLRTEADNWFLNEFRGRYESLLKIVAENSGCSHGTIMAEYAKIDGSSEEKQIGGYLNALINKYQVIERRLPMFSVKGASKKHRYYIADNFLLSWLGAIERQVKASKIRPLGQCVSTCSARLEVVEGRAFEKMVRLLVQELSSRGDEAFSITDVVQGYWNRPESADRSIEIDQVLVNDEAKTVRLATCKRSPRASLADAAAFDRHIEGFLATSEGRRFRSYRVIKTAFAPDFPDDVRARLEERGYEACGLDWMIGRL